ncbi:MAG: hypothetical protein M0Z46_03270 [Actinomycetota bacterium]|nr:hypothetical protein [Actinomycetota bacterium]
MNRAHIRTATLHHTTEAVRRLRSATNPDAGLLVAAVPPDLRRSYALTWELLAGLGKQSGVSGAAKREDLNWEVLAAWIFSHGVRHLVVVDAQWIGARVLPELVGMAAATGVTLWLVAHHPITDDYFCALGDWPTTPATPTELANIVEAAIAQRSANADEYDEDVFPSLPADPFVTFRAEARQRLPEDVFGRLDARYRSAHAAGRDWFAGREPGEVDAEGLVRHLRGRLQRCASAEAMLIEVRALQAAAYSADWSLSVDLPRFKAMAENVSAAAVESPETWRRLRAYREPYRGAACALVARELAVDTMLALRIDDVSGDGRSVSVERNGVREEFSVPPGAELYLRAQVWHRRLQGAVGTELLFATEEGPMTDRYLSSAIRAPASEVAVPLYSQQVERGEVTAKRWVRRWGLAVQAL